MKQKGNVINFHRIIPTTAEFIGLLLLTVLVVFLGSTKTLINYYGLSSTDQLIQQSTSAAVSNGLSKLDAFSITDRLVTFLVWAGVGVLCFNIVQGISRLYHQLEEEEQVSSNRYIHPKTFARSAFWRGVAIDFIGTVSCLALLAAALYCLVGYVLPVSLTYTQTFLTGPSLAHAGQFAIGFFMLYGWIVVLTIAFKLLINRHRLAVR